MVRYCYIVAEGHQDIEFLIRLLKSYGLKGVTLLSKLDSFWKPLVPTTFPIDDDMRKRVPVPVFLQNAELSVALHSQDLRNCHTRSPTQLILVQRGRNNPPV
jgi:hypothetical protein